MKGCGIKHSSEVLDAKIIGARKALEAALGLLEMENGGGDGRQQINVLTDSQSAVKALLTGIATTSLEHFKIFAQETGCFGGTPTDPSPALSGDGGN